MRKIKKLISLFVVSTILLVSSIICVSAINIEYNGFSVDIDSSSSTAKIVEYYGSDTDITIPASVYGYTVTSIDQYAFYQNDTITSVVFPNTVTSIGYMAFAECPNLKSVINSNALTSMDNSVFYKCTSLEEVYINSALTRIPDSTFSGCSSLKKVRLNIGVKTIGFSAFSDCTSLTVYPEAPGVTTIEDYAFYNCRFTTLDLESNIASVGDYAFASNPNLSSATIANDNVVLGTSIFGTPSENFVVNGSVNSNVKQYCEDNGYTFIADIIYGDVNGDETVNIKDVTSLQKHLAGISGFVIKKNTSAFTAADVDGDGIIDISDANLIFRFTLNKISKFPVEG